MLLSRGWCSCPAGCCPGSGAVEVGWCSCPGGAVHGVVLSREVVLLSGGCGAVQRVVLSRGHSAV